LFFRAEGEGTAITPLATIGTTSIDDEGIFGDTRAGLKCYIDGGRVRGFKIATKEGKSVPFHGYVKKGISDSRRYPRAQCHF